MEEQQGASAQEPKSADDRIAELEAKLNAVTRDYSASSREAKRLADHVQALQSAYEAPRQDVPQRNTAGQRLAEAAIPVDALEEYIDQRANRIADQKFAAGFEPLMRGVQARQTMVGKYKDYAKFESDIGELLNSDPEFQQTYNRVFQADPVAAFELAYFRLGETKRRSRNSSRDHSNGEELAEAQIPNQRAGDSRRIPTGHEAAVDAAARAYRENPNRVTKDAYVRARLKTAISDDFLNQ